MNHTMRLSLFASLVLVSLSLSVSAPASAQQNTMTFFVTSVGPGKGADLGGLEGADRQCQALAQAVGAGNRTWRAYLSTQAVGRRSGRQRPRSHRARAVAERQGRRHRQRCRRAARQQQSHQTDSAQREGRGGQRPWRYAQPARHPDRLDAGRPRLSPRRGPDLRQLDEERPGSGHGRPSRPHGAERGAASEVVEFVASVARARRWLQPGRSAQHRRRWVVILFRRQLAQGTSALSACGCQRRAKRLGL